MKKMLIAVVAVMLGSTPVAAQEPEDPHGFFNRPGDCIACHEPGSGPGGVEEHEFVIDISDLCRGCHAPEQLGRSHPVDVDPREAGIDVAVAETLPVSTDGNITCGTCHNPHLSGRSAMRLWETQKLEVACNDSSCLRYFKSYYLRVTEEDRGFDPLCGSCHAAYL